MSRKIIGLTLCSLLLAPCFSAEAQQPAKMPRIGYLSSGSPSSESPMREAFRQGLRDLGYIDGQNVAIEERFGTGKQYAALAAELVNLKVDLIVVGGGATALAAK